MDAITFPMRDSSSQEPGRDSGRKRLIDEA
jgi:hypothetical protein